MILEQDARSAVCCAHYFYLILSESNSTYFGPNVVVEWLTLFICIREVSVSNLGPGDRLS
jgi:hypothetical protein